MSETTPTANMALPRIAITYCTRCKWMLRAAYFGQELLSTFGTTIGEIALIPATGGLFTVHLTYKAGPEDEPQTLLIWDRKTEGGFPETKILKQKVRNFIQPEKNLGHSDTPSSKAAAKPSSETQPAIVEPVNTTTKEEQPGATNAAPAEASSSAKPSLAPMDTAVADPLIEEALSATPKEHKSPEASSSKQEPLAIKTEVDEDVQDPLVQEAMSATMSPSDRKQAEYAFMVATQHDADPWQQYAESAPRTFNTNDEKNKGKGKGKEDVVDEALERLKRDVAGATPKEYQKHCEDCD